MIARLRALRRPSNVAIERLSWLCIGLAVVAIVNAIVLTVTGKEAWEQLGWGWFFLFVAANLSNVIYRRLINEALRVARDAQVIAKVAIEQRDAAIAHAPGPIHPIH